MQSTSTFLEEEMTLLDGEGPDFLAQKVPIVMAYWGAANTETAYGNPDFELQVIGFEQKSPATSGLHPLAFLFHSP